MTKEIKPLGFTLGPMLSAFTRPMKAMIKQEGIPYSLEHLILLKVVKDCKESLVQQDLAEKLGKDKSVILRIVDILEKDGLLRRVVDPNDRRRNILEVAPAGMEFIEFLHKIELSISEKLLSNIDEKDVDTFFKVANQIKENAEKL